MMKKEDARVAIVREWQALPMLERQTDAQALAFAIKAKERYPFRASGDAYQHIMSWIRPYVGKP
jgi:hypothetical protein